MLDSRETKRSYDRVATTYADRLDHELDGKPIDRALLGALARLAGLDRQAGVIADLGSGPGHVGRHLAEVSGMAVVAVDLSSAMAHLALHRHGVGAAAGSLTALPLADGALGAAVAFYCFIHLDQRGVAEAAAELHRALRPGGVVIVAIHTGDATRHVEELMDTPVALDFRFMPASVLEDALRDAGLEIEATLERRGDPTVEADTMRAYVIARRAAA
jgi:SAM-dependent methyltransferase